MADKLQLWETFDEFSAFFGGYRNLLAVLGKKTFPLDSPSICIDFFIHGLYFLQVLLGLPRPPCAFACPCSVDLESTSLRDCWLERIWLPSMVANGLVMYCIADV